MCNSVSGCLVRVCDRVAGVLSGMLRLHDSERGSIVVMTAMTVIPMMAMTGLAIDTAHYFSTRSRVQSALDTSVLTAARNLQRNQTLQQAKVSADEYFRNNKPPHVFVGEPNWTEKHNSLRTESQVSSTVPVLHIPLMLKLIGINELRYEVSSQASYSTIQGVEIVFAIDFSSPMASEPGVANPKYNTDYILPDGTAVNCDDVTVYIDGCERKIDIAFDVIEKTLTELETSTVFTNLDVEVGLVPYHTGVRLPTRLYEDATGRSPPYERLYKEKYKNWGEVRNSWGGYTVNIAAPSKLCNPGQHPCDETVVASSPYTEESLRLPHDNPYLGVGNFITSDPDLDVEEYDVSCEYAADVWTEDAVTKDKMIQPDGKIHSDTFCITKNKCVTGRRNDLTDSLPVSGGYYEDYGDICVGPPIFPLFDARNSRIKDEINRWKVVLTHVDVAKNTQYVGRSTYELNSYNNMEAGMMWARNLLSPNWQSMIRNQWPLSAQINAYDGAGINAARKVIILLTSMYSYDPIPVTTVEIGNVPVGSNPAAPRVVERSDIVVEDYNGPLAHLNRFSALCEVVKHRGIEIFIIGFDAGSQNQPHQHRDNYMKPCASGPQYFFVAESAEDLKKSIFDILEYIQAVKLDG